MTPVDSTRFRPRAGRGTPGHFPRRGGVRWRPPRRPRRRTAWVLLGILFWGWAGCGDDPAADHPPTAVLSGPRYCDLGAAALWNAGLSTDPDDDIILYRFQVSDGTTAGPQTDPEFLYPCHVPGLLEIQVEVEDATGRTSIAEATISVRQP